MTIRRLALPAALLASACLLPGVRAQTTNAPVTPPAPPRDPAPAASAPATHAVPAAGAAAPAAAAAPAPAAPAPHQPVTTSLFSISGDTNRAGMTITSERLEFDYKEFVVAFDGRVRVSDQQFNLTADRVLVFLAGTNQIARILAIGSVNISQTDRRATCDRAVYEKDTGKVSLTGTPVLTRGNDRITGSEVVIFLNDQRVIVTDGRMWIAPESMKNRELAP